MSAPTTEKPNPDLEDIVDELKSYINTSIDLYKLKASEKGAEIASSAIINVVMGVFVGMVFLFASLALAFCLSEYFDKMYLGFLVVAGIYTVLALVILLAKDRWLKSTLIDNIIKAIYSK